MARVMAAMSGGVDSSVAALLLKRQGHEVFGATAALWRGDGADSPEDSGPSCCSLASAEDARKVCWQIGIRHHVFNLRDVFEEKVIQNFYNEYKNGRTPNPCVLCNSEIKWSALFSKARALECEFLATGHYSDLRVLENGRVGLYKAKDGKKDQTYFLWSVTQETLSHTLFPLAGLTKDEVRKIARDENLAVSNKPESQEVCFVPDQDYGRFFREWSALHGETLREGDIVDLEGRVVGRHQGLPLYTLGQRKGIGHHLSQRKFVVTLDPEKNQVVIGDEPDLLRSCFVAGSLNWIGFTPPADQKISCRVRIRYRQQEKEATVLFSGSTVTVQFQEPQRAITPGQSAVFYQDDRVLGGGIIEKVLDTDNSISLFR